MAEIIETPSPSPEPAWDGTLSKPTVTYNWVESTDDFNAACEELNLEELIHDSNFGLFEAMSAIEMMDPKMDAGMAGKQTNRKILSFTEAVEAKSIKLNNFLNTELIGIIDTNLCCLLSWLEGQSLAQSVFTCLYLHNPSLIEDRFLKACAICILKICDKIWDIVNNANVFEEEDFQTLTYGFKFANSITDLRAVGMMKEVEEDLARRIRNLKSSKIENDDTELSLNTALMARIKFLKTFLQILVVYGKKELETVVSLKKQLTQLHECLNVISTSMKLGIESTTSDDGHRLMVGFEPLVNQKLLPPTYPRYTTLKQLNEIQVDYEELINRLKKVLEVSNCSGFKNVLEFVRVFGADVPCVFSRSVLQLTFLPENRKAFGKHTMQDYIRDAMRLFNAPPILSSKCPSLSNHPIAKQHIDAFLARASRVATSLIKVYGHNQARQREKLAGVLEDFSSLQDDADRVDTELNAIYRSIDGAPDKNHLACLGSWTLYYTLKIMIDFVLSGFELELYSIHELHYIYWYLAEVLISWIVTALNRAEAQIAKDDALESVQTKGRNSKKSKKNKRKFKVHINELAYMQGLQMNAAGCFKVILGFFISGKIKSPDFILDNEQTRYEHRFLPFASVSTPPFMPYQQFKEMTDVYQYTPVPTAEDLYSSASKHFMQAKNVYEHMSQTEEIKNLTKVAKTNLVVTKLLAGGHKKDSTEKPMLDFTVHKYFPIIKVM